MQLSMIFSFACFLTMSSVSGQNIKLTDPSFNQTSLPGIQIGAQVPEVLLNKIIQVNGSLSKGKLSDFDDRLLILDFMYTSCSSCIEGLVKKNTLQNHFGNKVKFFAVVGGENFRPGMLKRENEQFIRAFLTSKNYLNFHEVKIPWVVENYELNLLFPHVNVSHLVWIYKGKVVAITEQDYVTTENIQSILDEKRNTWHVKNDFLPPFNTITPLVDQSPEQFHFTGERNTHAAAFGMFQAGFYTKHGTQKDTLLQIRRDYHINIPLLNLYRLYWYKATGESKNLQPSHIILNVKEPSSYVFQEDNNQYDYIKRQKTLRCVEVQSVDTGQTEKTQARHMLKEFENLFKLEGHYERRNMKCLILYRTDNKEKFKSKSNAPQYPFSRTTTHTPDIKFKEDLMRNLVYKMNQYYGNPPVFDETNFTGLIDINFKLSSWTNIPEIRKELQVYGLDLQEAEREVEVFILSEK